METTTNKQYFYKVSGKHVETINIKKCQNEVNERYIGTLNIIKILKWEN